MRCASALSSALCSDLACCVSGRHTNQWQGFGKAKNRIGMARPKKRKVEATETIVEPGAEGKCDTGVTGEQHPAIDDSIQTAGCAATVSASSGPGGKRWQVAWEKWEEAYRRAICLRAIAGQYEAEEKLARRLHDAKMQRLDNGDKLKRRKSPFRAACRTYEAIIDLNEAQLKCAWARCEAAEAERDAAQAELRLNELA